MTDDASYIDDDEIVENVVDCPGCNEPCGHEILKEKPVKAGVNYLLKCDECGHVHNYQLREPKPITIPFLLSEGANTVTVKIELDDDEILSIGDIFEYSDASWEINRIENEENISVSNLIPVFLNTLSDTKFINFFISSNLALPLFTKKLQCF